MYIWSYGQDKHEYDSKYSLTLNTNTASTMNENEQSQTFKKRNCQVLIFMKTIEDCNDELPTKRFHSFSQILNAYL